MFMRSSLIAFPGKRKGTRLRNSPPDRCATPRRRKQRFVRRTIVGTSFRILRPPNFGFDFGEPMAPGEDEQKIHLRQTFGPPPARPYLVMNAVRQKAATPDFRLFVICA